MTLSSKQQASINPIVLRDAAEWFARLNGEDADQQAQVGWRSWLQASPAHQQAWAQVEAIDNRIRALDSPPAKVALTAPATSRRAVLKTLLVAGIGLPLAGRMGWQISQPLRADYATAVGDIKQHTLADGTRLWLNTGTAINVRYTVTSRSIELLQGELAIRTAKDPRPLLLNTTMGQVQPLGTWFTVHQGERHVQVSVYSGRVAVTPAKSGRESIINANHQARFTAYDVTDPTTVAHANPGWTQGMLVADGMPLKDVINELSRYRHGHLGVADEVANLRLVGAFPLQQTDRVLAAIEQSLPVKVVQLTPWWVRVQPQEQ